MLAERRIQSPLKRFCHNVYKWRRVYILFIPVAAYYIIFHYLPMYGAIIAFKNYTPATGFAGAKWVGLNNVRSFLRSYYFWRLIKNTLMISLTSIVFGFPAPILLALLLNELKSSWYKRVVQTVTYFPHFLSIMVVCGMIHNFFATGGVVNDVIVWLGGTRQDFLSNPGAFRPLYVGSDIWQGIGWSSIVYLAALSGIDPTLYEAAKIDGAGRSMQVLHITLPGIMPTIILLYNNLTMETADVISSFVYRKGLLNADYSYSSAVGLFNSVINFALVVTANKLSRLVRQTSLW